ncbi:TPA: hypothetical protein DDW35_06970 [Candidatus Sumerlaeota bacterium]|nr:hypothetical protein [Candidatus Sumerlaeota bacterium]
MRYFFAYLFCALLTLFPTVTSFAAPATPQPAVPTAVPTTTDAVIPVTSPVVLPSEGLVSLHNTLLLFPWGTAARIPKPTGVTGNWVLLDAQGYHVQESVFSATETFLSFPGLPEGAYYLFWDYPTSGLPSLNAPFAKRISFVVLPPESNQPADHFFAVNHLNLATDLLRSKGIPEAEFLLPFEALSRLGIHRMRVDISAETAAPKRKHEYDFRAVDQVVKAAGDRGVRLIAMLGQDPEYPTELLRKYEFQLDEFTLRSAIAKQAPAIFLEKSAPIYRALKERSPYCDITIGGLPTDGTLLPNLLQKYDKAYDGLDFTADGSLIAAEKLTGDIRTLVPNADAQNKALIIASAGCSVGNDSINEQWAQAHETLKKMFWFKYQGYRYFSNAVLIDPEKDTNNFGLFSAPTRDFPPQPRLLAAAWARAIANLANAKPIKRLGYSGPKVEAFAFARPDSVIVTAWVPQVSGDTRTDKRSAITLRWPNDTSAIVQNILGQNVTTHRLVKRAPGQFDLVLNEDPVYLIISTSQENVGW